MTLAELGWRPMLQQQISLDELETGFAARVCSVFRDHVRVVSVAGELTLPLSGILLSDNPVERPVSGDWLWLEHQTRKPLKLFERNNILQRTAANSEFRPQLIAANIDTLFIVSSCNQDFNLSRLERYLSLVLAAHIPAVILLTKADLCHNVEEYVERAQALHHDVPVLSINALSAKVSDTLKFWLGRGQTIAFIGSSGVGKSSLTNALIGQPQQQTSGIRENDAKGRHTTTQRNLLAIPDGGWVLDTPGMRELRLSDNPAGIADVFDDIEALQHQCKFANCHHGHDKGCAIQQALDNGKLELRRWQNYQKLHREVERSGLNKQQQHAQMKKSGKEIRKAQQSKKALRHWDDD